MKTVIYLGGRVTDGLSALQDGEGFNCVCWLWIGHEGKLLFKNHDVWFQEKICLWTLISKCWILTLNIKC